MKKVMIFAGLLLVWSFIFASSFANEKNPVAWWRFDEVRVEKVEVEVVRGQTFIPKEVYSYVRNDVGEVESDLFGKYYEMVKGVKGKSVLLDGYTAYIEVKPDDVPRVTGDFSVEAWIAIGAYPNNVCPIVDNQRDPAEGYYNGYFFGVDAL